MDQSPEVAKGNSLGGAPVRADGVASGAVVAAGVSRLVRAGGRLHDGGVGPAFMILLHRRDGIGLRRSRVLPSHGGHRPRNG